MTDHIKEAIETTYLHPVSAVAHALIAIAEELRDINATLKETQ